MQDLPSICFLSLNLSAGTRKPESGDLSSYTLSSVEDSEVADLYTSISVLIGGPLVANLLWCEDGPGSLRRGLKGEARRVTLPEVGASVRAWRGRGAIHMVAEGPVYPVVPADLR